jgi:hypothetical protein
MFEIPQRTVKIEFPNFKGLEVIASRDVTFEIALEVDEAIATGTKASMFKAVRTFVETGLISWNLSRKGEPVPATVEEMFKLPADLTSEILTLWVDVLKGIPAPLGEKSPDGEPSGEA